MAKTEEPYHSTTSAGSDVSSEKPAAGAAAARGAAGAAAAGPALTLEAAARGGMAVSGVSVGGGWFQKRAVGRIRANVEEFGASSQS